MSAFMMLFSFFAVSAPIFDLQSNQMVLVCDDTSCSYKSNVTCTECLESMDQIKNKTEFLNEITDDIEYVCGRLYNVEQEECLNLTHDMKRGLNYVNNHTSTMICEHLHYC